MAIYSYETAKGKRWRVQRTITKNHGERKTICKRGFISEKEARDYDIDLAYELKQNTYFNKDITLHDVYKDYLIDKEKEVALLWYRKIQQMYDTYIYKYFGNKNIYSITTFDIIKWKRQLNNLSLSTSYKQKIFITLNAIFKHAMLCFNLQENILDKVGTFKNTRTTNKQNIIIWQKEEVTRFLLSFDLDTDYTYYAFFATEIYTGMRNCEAFALTWNDIDFIKKTIDINKSLTQKIKGTRAYIGNTKNITSKRIIDIPDVLYTILLEQYHRDSILNEFDKSWFVFGNTLPIAETTMNEKRKKYCKLANVPIISCHKIRHTHISHLIANGANPLSVAKRVGHASTKMTLDIYGHSINQSDQELLNIVSNIYSLEDTCNEE